MPAYVGTNVFVKVGATTLSNYWKSVNLEPTAEARITTRGNAQHQQRTPAIKDTKLSIAVGYDTSLNTIVAALRPGTQYTVEIGPEGTNTGEPRHVQDFILLGAPLKLETSKEEVVFELSFEAADGPTIDMYNGGVY